MPPHLQGVYRRAAAANAPLLALLQGAIDQRHELAIIADAAVPWPSRISKCAAPYATLIADDPWPNGDSLGPAGWACARGARRWARSVIIHGTGPSFHHYRFASAATQISRALLLIETDSAHIDEWAAFVGCPSTLIIRPPAGCVHPSQDGETRH